MILSASDPGHEREDTRKYIRVPCDANLPLHALLCGSRWSTMPATCPQAAAQSAHKILGHGT